MTAFGTIFDAGALDDAVAAALVKWGRDYVSEIGARAGVPRGQEPAVAAWVPVNELDFWPGDEPPAGLLFTGGNPVPLDRVGDGRHDGWWEVGLAIKVADQDRLAANRLVKRYGAAYRTLIMQKMLLEVDPLADNMRSLRESYGEVVPPGRHDYASAVVLTFDLHIPTVGDATAGPRSATPLADPAAAHPDLPTVLTTSLNVTKTEGP